MRELLYISDAKLERFVNDRQSVVPKDLLLEAELSIASLLKVKAANEKSRRERQSSAHTMKKVEEVVAHIDSSDRPALWLGDSAARVGRWIQFDTHLSFAVTEDMFLAWSSGPHDPEDTEAEPGLPNPLLLLHGSAHHVVGSTAARERRANSARRIGGAGGGSEPALPYYIAEQIGPLLRHREGQGGDLRALIRRVMLRRRPRHMSEVYDRLLHASRLVDFDCLAGFARVTAIHDVEVENWDYYDSFVRRKLVLATPLYVERVASSPSRE